MIDARTRSIGWSLTGDDGRVSLSDHFGGCIDEVQQHRSVSASRPMTGVRRILIDGYVLPRRGSKGVAGGRKGEVLIRHMWDLYGYDFIHHVKGVFTIVVLHDDGAEVFSDHLGVGKVFYARTEGGHVLSNRLDGLPQDIRANADPASVAMNALFHHYVGGWTLCQGVYVTGPGAWLRVRKDLMVDSYWETRRLLEFRGSDVDYPEFAAFLVGLMEDYATHFEVKAPSLTLTGGMDSRVLLAAMLKSGMEPQTFTFGSPESRDAIVARQTAEACGLRHVVHEPPVKSEGWFDSKARQITEIGSSLAHIHRAHRLEGIEQEFTAAPETDLLVLGCMGGEGIRGLHADELIVTRFVLDTMDQAVISRDSIHSHLKAYWIRENHNVDVLVERISSLPFWTGSPKEREFHVLFDMVAGIHQGQDVNLYAEAAVSLVLPMYMDIDYLELLFSSPFSMRHKLNRSKNPIARLNIPAFSSGLVAHLCPKLADVPFANGFAPSDYVSGRMRYILRRIQDRMFGKPRKPNFAIGDWMRSYVLDYYKHDVVDDTRSLYDVDAAKRDLELSAVAPVEKAWRRYTDIVATDMSLQTYVH